jgi:hypothetical protein
MTHWSTPGADGVPRLVGWRHREPPDRGGCPACAQPGRDQESLGSSAKHWTSVHRCRVCGGLHAMGERSWSPVSRAEADYLLELRDDPPDPVPEEPPVLDVVVERPEVAADGRWLLPPLTPGLGPGSPWAYRHAEALALVAEVLHRIEPGTTGRVWRLRRDARPPGRPASYSLMVGLPLDADRFSDRMHRGHLEFPHGSGDRWDHPGFVRWIGDRDPGDAGSDAGRLLSAADLDDPKWAAAGMVPGGDWAGVVVPEPSATELSTLRHWASGSAR